MLRWNGILSSVLLLPVIWAASVSLCFGAEVMPTVGIEGTLEAKLPDENIEALSAHDRSELILHVKCIDVITTGSYRYDLRYMGMVPGEYDLRNYLLTPDGLTTQALPVLPVTVASALPADFKGELAPDRLRKPSLLRGYRGVMLAVLALWISALFALIFAGRRKKEITAEKPRFPSLADRLRPLVIDAAEGRLSLDGKARLERMLVGYWRIKLGLTGDMAQCITELKRHPEADALILTLEQWLHRPPGAKQVNVAELLAPYREIAAEHDQEGEADGKHD
ncbi:hypothetical protein JXA32_04925 [Candidatus Sumerlaeota bacterium]|nr:hypothetical protein [Candidatus Sumerlaeota bacterium]